jgi:carbamoyltransferase
MYLLGLAGLVGIESFLEQHFPAQMAMPSRIVQGMDAAAALICDGQVIAAASEERFDRRKKSGAFPIAAIDFCLNSAGIDMTDVDQVCGNFDFGPYRILYQNGIAKTYWQECLSPNAITARLATHYATPIDFRPIDHHDAHLHCALASADFEDCLAIVMDAAGEVGATTVYRIEEGKVKRLRRYAIFQSLGMFYSLITQFLGFLFNEDEYKIMGLAALGGHPQRYTNFFESMIHLKDDGGICIPALEINQGFEQTLFFSSSSRAIAECLGFDGSNCSMARRADVSAALQRRFTEALFHIAEYFQRQTGMPNLLLSGGCAENCAAIGELRRASIFKKLHVAYGSGDEGTALGAACARAFALGQPVRIPSVMPFFGPAPDIESVRALVTQHNLRLHRFDDEDGMLDAAARDIANDRIVAICNGRMEYGARALGNRSLLALPANLANKERINLAIKKRQNYRPFAPAVTIEDAHRYFDLNPGEAYPYMTMLTKVRQEYIHKLPAVIHFDGTARVQTVDPDHNPAFYRFLRFLEQRTGVPVVLNTSYNVNHQPIVCSEAEAIETFVEMGIDALYIADARVTR